MQFCQMLDTLMKDRGWSAYRLAKLMDISQSTIHHWLAGDSNPQRGTLRRLEEVFGLERGYFEQKEKPATENSDGLDDDKVEWSSAWDNATPAQRKAALAVLRLQVPTAE